MLSAQMRGRWAGSKRGVLKAGRLTAVLGKSTHYARIHFQSEIHVSFLKSDRGGRGRQSFFKSGT
jgi:hypothetical protein